MHRSKLQSYSITSSASANSVDGRAIPSSQVDDEREFRWLLDREVSRPRVFQCLVNILSGSAAYLALIWG